MKLSNVFTVLLVTSLAIAKADVNVGTNDEAGGLRGGQGTRQVRKNKNKNKNKNKFETKAIDVRLTAGLSTTLFKYGPIKVIVECTADHEVELSIEVKNDSSDVMGVFGQSGEGPLSGSFPPSAKAVLPFASFEEGNLDGLASVGTSTGYYVSLNGETAIGLTSSNSVGVTPIAVTPIAVTPIAVTPIAVTPIAVTPIAVTPIGQPIGQLTPLDPVLSSVSGLPEYGEDIDCVFMGVFTMFKNKNPKFVN
jgi:hypothetical protein